MVQRLAVCKQQLSCFLLWVSNVLVGQGLIDDLCRAQRVPSLELATGEGAFIEDLDLLV